jgi:hypothetical protein
MGLAREKLFERVVPRARSLVDGHRHPDVDVRIERIGRDALHRYGRDAV